MARHRIYEVRNIDDSASVSIQGDLVSYMARWATMFPRYVNRVVRHAAYMTQRRMKAEMLEGAPGGEPLAPLSWIQRVRALDYYRKYGRPGTLEYGREGGEWPVGGRLARAFGYQMYNREIQGAGFARVGWLSWSVAALGVIFQQETARAVTPELRRLFSAAGVPLSPGKTALVKPARPVIAPFLRHRGGWIRKVMEDRFFQYMRADAERAARQLASKTI